jgi:hypothetical protein
MNAYCNNNEMTMKNSTTNNSVSSYKFPYNNNIHLAHILGHLMMLVTDMKCVVFAQSPSP